MKKLLSACLLFTLTIPLHAEPVDVVEKILHSDKATMKATLNNFDALSAPEKTKVIEMLERAVNSHNIFDAPRAAYALGCLGANAAAAIPTLEAKLDDQEPTLRFQAGLAITKLNPMNPTGAAAMVDSLEYPGPSTARLDALSTLGDEGISAKKYAPAVLARAMVDKDADVKKKAAAVYHVIDPGAKTDISVIESALKNDEPAFRRMAAHTIGEVGPAAKKSKSKLQSRLSDKDVYVRLAAAEAIYRIGAEDKKAISVFNSALASDDFILRHAAARSIRLIGPKAAPTVPALAQALNKSRAQLAERQPHETPEMGQDRGYRALLDLPYALSKALEAIGTPDAKDALIVK